VAGIEMAARCDVDVMLLVVNDLTRGAKQDVCRRQGEDRGSSRVDSLTEDGTKEETPKGSKHTSTVHIHCKGI
jgi:hypothetical protein